MWESVAGFGARMEFLIIFYFISQNWFAFLGPGQDFLNKSKLEWS